MLALPAKLNHEEVASSKNANWLEQARLAGWQIDAAGLQTFDSSALALLLDLRRKAVAASASLQVHNAPARLTQLATLYGVNELIA
ncbi:MAG: STAS domain-containing protein [Cytophagales bacterium]|nr:STAS domain-containing protein [Cytophagales bacterium]